MFLQQAHLANKRNDVLLVTSYGALVLLLQPGARVSFDPGRASSISSGGIDDDLAFAHLLADAADEITVAVAKLARRLRQIRDPGGSDAGSTSLTGRWC